MVERGFGQGFAAEHPGDFFDAAVAGQFADGGDGSLVVGAFFDMKMRLAFARNLRQMRDADNLMRVTDLLEFFPDDFRDFAADAGVNFVEDHHRHAIRRAKQRFQRKHHARNFAAGCDFA